MNNIASINIKPIIYLFLLNIIPIILLGSDYSLLFIPFNGSCILLYSLYTLSIKYGSTLFHPLPITCLLLFISFILAPIVSMSFDIHLLYAPRQIDWDKWLVIISWLYFSGIIFFYLGSKIAFRSNYNSYHINVKLDKQRLIIVSSLFLIVTLLSQIYVFYSFGGFISYLRTWSESREEFAGLGIWFMLSEPFPIIFMLFMFLLIGKEKLSKSIIKVAIIFLIFFVLKIIFGGLRGSRSNTIWGIFWFAGIVHLYLFRLKKIHILVGVIFLATFMSIYTIYKSYGIESFSGEYTISDTNRFQNNPLLEMYLGDFSRATLNAYQVSQIQELRSYEFKYGQTYISSLTKLIPPLKEIYTGHNKNSAGAEILSSITVNPTEDNYHNSRVYGLYGEAILNFGIYIGLTSFFIFGLFCTMIDNISRKYLSRSVFILFIPFVANFTFTILTSDSDNVIFFTFKNGLVAFLYLYTVHKFCRVKIYYSDS